MARTPSAARETRALPKFHHHLTLHAQGILPILRSACAKQDGGRGGIRTHGGLPHARFRVECLKPDSATLPNRSILSMLFYDAQLLDVALSLQGQSIARPDDFVRVLQNGSAQHRGISGRHPCLSCRAFPSKPKISEKCYNFRLAEVVFFTAYCVSARTVALLLVVDWNSQVVSAAVHHYSHAIQNLNPPSLP